jgi:RNA polymerase sigma-70 factor (sigma-E family)
MLSKPAASRVGTLLSTSQAARLDTKHITALLGHSRTSFTDDAYVTVFPEAAKAAAAALAAVPLGMLWRRGIAGWPPSVFKGGRLEADVNERDRQEFAEFAAAHSGALIRLAYVLTGEQLAAEDLLQTALTKAAARWGRIHSAPEAYVRQIMYREQVSGWRRRAHRRETTMADVPDQAAAVPAASAETRLALLEALRALPAGKRAVLALRYLEDLGCSVGTVRSQTHKAITQLRSALASAGLTSTEAEP